MIDARYLYNFVVESNRIEGINLDPREAEFDELKRFVELDAPTIEDLVKFIGIYQPDAVLRDETSIPGVRVGNHIAPSSGPTIAMNLAAIIGMAHGGVNPHEIHHDYETLHPFTDGNGRSGRALWLWQMVNQHGYDGSIGFLHKWYYQSLAAGR